MSHCTPAARIAPSPHTDAPRPDQRHAALDKWHANRGPLQKAPSIIAPTCVPPTHPRRAARGFTLIEMLVAVAVTGVLSTVALPSFEAQLQKGRRADVLVSTMLVQAAQERHRSNGANYGSLAAVGIAARSSAGHYLLALPAVSDDGYELLAVATGAQARDTACSHMKLTVAGANLVYASGSNAAVANTTQANRACWNL
jgi:type IV pilus assembly protein PilE